MNERDKQLQQFLKGEDAIHKAYRAGDGQPAELPPELLDTAILNRARRAVDATPARARHGLLRWGSAFAGAAVMVLAVTVFVNQSEQMPQAPVPEAASDMMADSPQAMQKRDSNSDPRLHSQQELGNTVMRQQAAETPAEQPAPRREMAPPPAVTASDDLSLADEDSMELDRVVTTGSRLRRTDSATPDGAARPASPAPTAEMEPVAEILEEREQAAVAGSADIEPDMDRAAFAAKLVEQTQRSDIPLINTDPQQPATDEGIRADAGLWLLALDALKHNNDPRLADELAAFRCRYPDHALPESLSR